MGVISKFATRLKALREVAGLTQSQLADKLTVSRGSISYYENEDRVPDVVFLSKAACFFGVSFDYLMGCSAQKSLDNDDISLKLGITEKAIIDLRERRVDGSVISAIIEHSASEGFFNSIGKFFDLSLDLSQKELSIFELEYLSFQLSRTFMDMIIDTAKEKRIAAIKANFTEHPERMREEILKAFIQYRDKIKELEVSFDTYAKAREECATSENLYEGLLSYRQKVDDKVSEHLRKKQMKG